MTIQSFIRVQIGDAMNGHNKWYWEVALSAEAQGRPLSGVSRTPLLDACRAIKRMGGDANAIVGLFREGRDFPDMTCTVGAGSSLSGGRRRAKYPVCSLATLCRANKEHRMNKHTER